MYRLFVLIIAYIIVYFLHEFVSIPFKENKVNSSESTQKTYSNRNTELPPLSELDKLTNKLKEYCKKDTSSKCIASFQSEDSLNEERTPKQEKKSASAPKFSSLIISIGIMILSFCLSIQLYFASINCFVYNRNKFMVAEPFKLDNYANTFGKINIKYKIIRKEDYTVSTSKFQLIDWSINTPPVVGVVINVSIFGLALREFADTTSLINVFISSVPITIVGGIIYIVNLALSSFTLASK